MCFSFPFLLFSHQYKFRAKIFIRFAPFFGGWGVNIIRRGWNLLSAVLYSTSQVRVSTMLRLPALGKLLVANSIVKNKAVTFV
jgi:hypothetical protein